MFIATDAIPGRLDLRSGANRKWNYIQLKGLSREQFLRPAAVGQYAGKFPSAKLMLTNSGRGEVYYNLNGRYYELLGMAGWQKELGLNGLMRFQPALVERRSPLTYREDYEQESTATLTYAKADIPQILSKGLPSRIDSVRFNILIQQESQVDAWGKLRIPEDVYEVLRERVFESRQTKLETWQRGKGWQELSSGQMSRLSPKIQKLMGRQVSEFYRYFSDEVIEPIALVQVDPVTDTVQMVEFRSSITSVNRQKFVDNGKTNIYAYPNPAIDEARFDLVNLGPGEYQLKIFNILGMEIVKETYKGGYARKTVKVDLSKLKKGTYLYSLLDERGKTITTKRLLIIRP